MDFTGKRVMLTGAGKGIGRTLAEMLVQRGRVRLRAHPQRRRRRQAEGGTRGRGRAGRSRRSRRHQGRGRGGRACDYLINNAGTTELQSFLETTVEAFDRLMAVNTRAPMIVSQVYARERIAAGAKGAIVNVSSVASFIGIPDHAAYCASKGGIDALTRVMARELGPHGIRVNAVNPTVTLTPMAVKAWSEPPRRRPC